MKAYGSGLRPTPQQESKSVTDPFHLVNFSNVTSHNLWQLGTYVNRQHLYLPIGTLLKDNVEDRAEVCVYLDGSGIDGLAGAAAILFWDGQEVRSVCYDSYQLGSLTQHMYGL